MPSGSYEYLNAPYHREAYDDGNGLPIAVTTAAPLPVVLSGSSASQTVVGAINSASGAGNTIALPLNQASSAGFSIAAGTLAATLVPEISLDGGNSWLATQFVNTTTGVESANLVFTNPNAAAEYSILLAGGATNVRVRASSYSSGSASITLSATNASGGTGVDVSTGPATLSASTALQSAQTGNANGTVMPAAGYTSIVLTITTSGFTGTVNFEGQEDGATWVPIFGNQLGTVNISPTATTAGDYVLSVAGLQQVRARTSGVSAGNVTITGHASPTSWAPHQINALMPQLIAGEDLSGNGGVAGQVLGEVQKPIVTSGYSFTPDTSFGTVTKNNSKATPGNVLSVYCSNANAAVRYFQIHNKASAPAGTNVPLLSFPVPAGTANAPGVLILDNNFFLQNGIYLSTGISWAVSTTVATFTDSATASDHDVMVGYI